MVAYQSELAVVADSHVQDRRRTVEILSEGGYTPTEVVTGRETLRVVEELPVSLVMLEVRLEDFSGYEVCRILRERYRRSVAIMFVSRDRQDPCDKTAGLLLGADDYLGKPVFADELLARVRAILRRRSAPLISPRDDHFGELTRREHEILRLLADGQNQASISRTLVIAPRTVSKHIEHILLKLKVKSRAEAVAFAYQFGLDELGDPPVRRERAHSAPCP